MLPLSAQIPVPELCLQAHTGAGESSLLKLQIIYRSAGLGAVTSHIILKWFVNHGMGTAALEGGATSQNSYLTKIFLVDFSISVAMAYSL